MSIFLLSLSVYLSPVYVCLSSSGLLLSVLLHPISVCLSSSCLYLSTSSLFLSVYLSPVSVCPFSIIQWDKFAPFASFLYTLEKKKKTLRQEKGLENSAFYHSPTDKCIFHDIYRIYRHHMCYNAVQCTTQRSLNYKALCCIFCTAAGSIFLQVALR